MVSIAEDGYTVHLQFTPDLANDWKNAMLASSELAVGNYHYLTRRVLDSMNASQLESKLWIIDELNSLNIKPKVVGILAGWYSNFLTPLLLENLGVDFVWNFAKYGF